MSKSNIPSSILFSILQWQSHSNNKQLLNLWHRLLKRIKAVDQVLEQARAVLRKVALVGVDNFIGLKHKFKYLIDLI